MRERIKHEYFPVSGFLISELRREGTWFSEHGVGARLVKFDVDIRRSRLVVASMLCEAWNEGKFFVHNTQEPRPEEADRILQIAHLQNIASITGLLNGEEIGLIQEREGIIPVSHFQLDEVELLDFGLLVRKIKAWKAQGLRVGMLHGAYDPPTTLHLSLATQSYTRFPECDIRLVGFENDASLRLAKGEDRPRCELDFRRQVFGSFWMIDQTVVMRATHYHDFQAYVRDYQDLGVDYVFLAPEYEEKAGRLKRRLKQIRQAGAEPRFLWDPPAEFHSTTVIEQLREWGEI